MGKINKIDNGTGKTTKKSGHNIWCPDGIYYIGPYLHLLAVGFIPIQSLFDCVVYRQVGHFHQTVFPI